MISRQTPAPGNTPNELDKSETVGTGNTQIEVEMRPRKKKPVGILGPSKARAASLKRGSGIGTSQRPTTHAELLHLVDSLVIILIKVFVVLLIFRSAALV